MGVYFIAAGQSSRNRLKTLDRAWRPSDLEPYLSDEGRLLLHQHFYDNDEVFLWGANKNSLQSLRQVRTGEYVVDVKNKKVVQIFRFAFMVRLDDGRLQEYVGWDKEKPAAQRRPYQFVYFLKAPKKTLHTKKSYFQRAFGQEENQNWLVGQRYFSDREILEALHRTSTSSVEQFLGIPLQGTEEQTSGTLNTEEHNPTERPTSDCVSESTFLPPPAWLKPVVEKIMALRADETHLERDHEDLVAMLFEQLGYERISNIKFRRGNIDIRIDKGNQSWITIEVKADWSLSPKHKNALKQAYNYAHEMGTPFVIITNGDRYCLYDRRKGLSYKDNLIADFLLTELDSEAISALQMIAPQNLH